jgi:hypothetical protein
MINMNTSTTHPNTDTLFGDPHLGLILGIVSHHSNLTPSDLYMVYFTTKDPRVRSQLDSQECTSSLRTKYDLPYLNVGDDDSFLLVYTHWSYDHITPESIKYKKLSYILSKVAPSERARYTLLSIRHTMDPSDIQKFYDNYDSCFDYRIKNIPTRHLRSLISVVSEMEGCAPEDHPQGICHMNFPKWVTPIERIRKVLQRLLEICLFVGYSEGIDSILEMSCIHPDVSGVIRHGSKWVLSDEGKQDEGVVKVCILTGNVEMVIDMNCDLLYPLVMCNRLDWVKTLLNRHPYLSNAIARDVSPSQLEIATYLISLDRHNLHHIMANAKEEDSEALDTLESLYLLSKQDIVTIIHLYHMRHDGTGTYIYERYRDRITLTIPHQEVMIGVAHLRLLFCNNDTPIIDVYNPNNIPLHSTPYRYRLVSKDEITPYTVDVTHSDRDWIVRCGMIKACIPRCIGYGSVLEYPPGYPNGQPGKCSVLEYMLRCPDSHIRPSLIAGACTVHLGTAYGALIEKITSYSDLRLVLSHREFLCGPSEEDQGLSDEMTQREFVDIEGIKYRSVLNSDIVHSMMVHLNTQHSSRRR